MTRPIFIIDESFIKDKVWLVIDRQILGFSIDNQTKHLLTIEIKRDAHGRIDKLIIRDDDTPSK